MLVQSIQNALVKEVHNKLSYSVEIQWTDNMGSIHTHVKKQDILKTVSKIKKNYTTYYQREYVVKRILVKKIKNNNPHIQILLPLY